MQKYSSVFVFVFTPGVAPTCSDKHVNDAWPTYVQCARRAATRVSSVFICLLFSFRTPGKSNRSFQRTNPMSWCALRRGASILGTLRGEHKHKQEVKHKSAEICSGSLQHVSQAHGDFIQQKDEMFIKCRHWDGVYLTCDDGRCVKNTPTEEVRAFLQEISLANLLALLLS